MYINQLYGVAAVLALSASMACNAHSQSKSPTAKSGKYVVELRVPEEGLFSGEEVDIEFRVMDSTNDDPVLGMAGVPNAKISAVVTMPAMPGMPEAKPAVHSEGVPGDYGLIALFPHGGEYQITLSVEPPKETAFKVSFKVDVKDERTGKPAPKPFNLQIKDVGMRMAGQPTKLVMSIVDNKTKQVIKDFDEAHTQKFHLLLASKDFQWFLHEHPVQQPDGTWTIDLIFPAGGDYFVYGDVAPVGKGSHILANKVHVMGDAPKWKVDWTPTLGPSEFEGVRGMLSGSIPAGKMTTVTLQVDDSATGKPVDNLTPYLGAWGHLMIFSQDGATVVHSHPAENAEADDLVKKGTIQFSARFPKAGKYRAFAQVLRDGKVITLPFTLEVK